MRIKDLALLVFLSGLLISCRNRHVCSDEIIHVALDADSLVTLDLEEYPYVLIESPEMIGVIDRIQFKADRMLLKSKRTLAHFSVSGDFLGYISRFGRAFEEYLSILDFGFAGNDIFLYDMNGKKVMTFDAEGRLSHTFPLPKGVDNNPFQLVVPLGKQYVGKRMYCGFPGNPELSLYDENFIYEKSINSSSMHLRSGIFFGSQFAPYSSKSVLYNRSFDNRIYEVTRDTAMVRYVVDYGDRTIDIDKFKDEYEILKKINEKKHPYYTLIDCMEYDDGILSFSYAYTGDRNGYRVAFCDAAHQISRHYSFLTADQIAYAAVHQKVIYVFTQTEDGKTRLYRIPVGDC